MRKLRERLVRAISKFQSHVRKRLAKKRAKYYYLVRVLMEKRNQAAIIIQKHYKRFVT